MKIFIILRFTLILLLFAVNTPDIFCQGDTYRIFFKNKGSDVFEPGSNLYNETLQGISERALQRRLKTRNESNIISIEDAPVSKLYLNEIENAGGKILAVVKWENYCVAYFKNESDVKNLNNLDFIKYYQTTSSEFKLLNYESPKTLKLHQKESLLSKISITAEDTTINKYGAIQNVMAMIRIPEVHSLGISGKGALIGFLDSGFRPDSLSVLRNLQILDEYDFIYRDSKTSNQQFDHPQQDHHGTQVLSIAVANKPEFYLGAAPEASVALAKTENLHYERKIEEDWFYEGVEWLEALGVDVINASLGYFNFDSLQTSYIFDDLTGNKAITSRAVNKAAERGVLFIVAAGNNGPGTETINTPADADSVLAVGSVNFDKNVSRFSSRGGDALQRKRPHLSAQGGGVLVVNPNNDESLFISGGTSLSSPVISGAAALIISAFPEIKPYELKDILFKSADNYPEQNNVTGYGIPDIYRAVTNYGIYISPPVIYSIHHFRRVLAKVKYIEPISEVSLFVQFYGSGFFDEFRMIYGGDNYFFAELPINSFKMKNAYAYITAKSESKSRRMPIYEDSLFPISPENLDIVPFGLTLHNDRIRYVETAGSFVYPSIIPRFSRSINLITYSDSNSEVRVYANDLLGKEIFKKIIDNPGIGIIETEIPTNDLLSGIYTIRVISSGRNETIKFIIY